jgi:predicted transcriptional regulator
MSSTNVDNRRLSVETLHELLADRQRRLVIEHLHDTDRSTIPLTDLVDVLRTQEDEESKRQARISLLHKHLPKLADYDIVEYDRHDEVVRYRGDTQLETLVEISTFYE